MLPEKCSGRRSVEDRRTAAQCREIEQLAGGREAVIQMVSNPALTGFTAPKILWLRENRAGKI